MATMAEQGKTPKTQAAPCRVVRCDQCGAYLMHVYLVRCEPGSRARLVIKTKCRNRKCRSENEVNVDAENAEKVQVGIPADKAKAPGEKHAVPSG